MQIASRARLYILAICLSITFFPSAVSAEDDWGLLSARLAPLMTERQVMTAIGYRPNKVELQTCGRDAAGGSWQCKKFMFGSLNYNLSVFFENHSDHTWRVNSWFVYP